MESVPGLREKYGCKNTWSTLWYIVYLNNQKYY
jgi:hypothetical protein